MPKKKTEEKEESLPQKTRAKSAVKKSTTKKNDISKDKETKPLLKYSEEKKNSKGSKTGFIIFIFAVIVLIAAVGWYKSQESLVSTSENSENFQNQITGEITQIQDKLNSLTQELAEQKQEEIESYPEYLVYTSDELGINFQYPENLGEVTVELIENEEGESDNIDNETLTITFSANPDIWLVAAKTENDQDNPLIYNGSEEDLTIFCDEPLAVSDTGYCDLIAVSGVQTVQQVIRIGEEEILNNVKSVPLNLDAEYDGLRINVSLGLPPVTGRNLFAPTDDEAQEEALFDFYRDLIKKENLSPVLVQNLNDYLVILNTFNFEGE